MRHLREIFDDRWTKAAAIVFLLIIGLTIFNLFSNFGQTHPLVAVLAFSLVPLSFIAGGTVFIAAIIHIFKQRSDL
jgi:hypothetical protein